MATATLKSILDPILAVLLILFTLPLTLVIAIAIRLSSHGGVFFISTRIGLHNKPFQLIKFRTMRQHADQELDTLLATSPDQASAWNQNFKLDNDPRITPFGRFLRKTSLDELPQLINVLKGDMALIGPRPIIHDEIPLYGDFFETLVSIKPGLTGLWQVSGRNDLPYHRRVELDMQYIKHASFTMDIIILAKTIREIFTAHGK